MTSTPPASQPYLLWRALASIRIALRTAPFWVAASINPSTIAHNWDPFTVSMVGLHLLTPAQYVWACWKEHELPNVCPKDDWQLSEGARRTLRRMRSDVLA